MTSVSVNQPQFTSLLGAVRYGLDTPGFGDQLAAFGLGDIVEGHVFEIFLFSGQDHDQQLVALMPRLRKGRLADAADGLQGLLVVIAQGVCQGQIASGVEVVRGQSQAGAEGALSSVGLANQNVRDAQTVPGLWLLQRVGGRVSAVMARSSLP